MAEINAKTVMELRAKTNAGMMDCKKALAESGGDLVKAEEILRKKGITKITERADRTSKEGVVHALLADGLGTMIEVNCETDFVSKNESFRAFVQELAEHVQGSAQDSLDALLAEPWSKGQGTVDEAVKVKGAQTGEVTLLRRFARFKAGSNAAVTTYLHMGGRIGVMIEVAAGKAETLAADGFKVLLKDLTLQIAASNPECLSREQVCATMVAKEREIYTEQAAASGKPAAVVEKMVEGRLSKFYAQICLLEQGFIKDQDQTVSSLIEATGKTLGDTVKIVRYARFAVGEELKA